MFEFIKKLLDYEKKYYTREKQLEEKKLLNGIQTAQERRDSDIWHSGTIAILEEINWIMEKLKEFDLEYYSFSIHGEIKPKKDGIGDWPNFWTFRKMLVKNEENRGKQEKAISIKFGPLVDWSKIKRGWLVVHKSKIYVPKIYEIKEENGKIIYPAIIVYEIYSFTPEPQIEED